MKKIFGLLLCVLVVGSALLGCAPAAAPTAAPEASQPTAGSENPPPAATSSEPVTLVVTSFNEQDALFFREAAEGYSTLHPNVTIDVQVVSSPTWSEYFDKISATVAGGGDIDIVEVATEGARLMETMGMIEPIDAYLDAAPEFKADLLADVDPKLWIPYQYEGALYGLPWYWDTCAIFYNTKMFEEAGLKPPSPDWTVEEFLSDAQKLTTLNADGTPATFGFENSYFQFCIEPWLFNAGGSILNEDMTASNVTNPSTIDALQWMHDLIWKYKVTPTGAEQGFQANMNLFAAGRIAMFATGRWSVLGYLNADFKDWEVVPFPKWREQKGIYGVGANVILKGSKNKDVAWDFVKYMNNPEWGRKVAMYGIPSRKSVAYDPEVMAVSPPADYKFWYDVLENALPVEAPPQYNKVESIFLRYLDMILKNQATVEEAVQQMDVELNAALQE